MRQLQQTQSAVNGSQSQGSVARLVTARGNNEVRCFIPTDAEIAEILKDSMDGEPAVLRPNFEREIWH